MPDESARVRLCGGAYCLVVQVQLARASRPGDDQLRQGALSDLPGTVHYHDTGIRQRLGGHLLGMPREQANPSAHRATLPRLTLGYGRSAGIFVGVLPVTWWAICR